MPVSFVIDNQQHRMADALNELLAQTGGKPLDIAGQSARRWPRKRSRTKT
jgi:hypothetical protein